VAEFTFNAERKCPACAKSFAKAEQKNEFEPVIVVVCPGCAKLLWRPGSEDTAALVLYNPEQDAGGI
jgi:hypothetical protein